jgi:ATP-dependent exoDNAse (exonuclease V) beta subunit
MRVALKRKGSASTSPVLTRRRRTSVSGKASPAAPRIPEDAAARAAALDPTGSFIVQAPAGSGKTELLVQRILVLLAQVDAPEELVALTFTRKAAAEMHERVLGALLAARANAPLPVNAKPADAARRALAQAVLARDAAAGWGLLDSPARLRIGTLDSFCADLVRRMPLASRMGGVPQVLDDATELYAEAAQATLALLDHGDAAQAAAVERLLDHLDNDGAQAVRLLAAMLARRDQWIRLAAAPQPRAVLEASLAQVRADLLAELRRAIEPVADDLVRTAARAAANLPAGSAAALGACRDLVRLPEGDDAQAETLWLGCIDLLLTASDKSGKADWRRRWTTNEGFPPQGSSKDAAQKARLAAAKAAVEDLAQRCAAIDGLLDHCLALRQLPPARYDDAQWHTLAAVLEVLKLAFLQLQLIFRARGTADFQAVAHAALTALTDAEHDGPSDLMLALDARIRHLMIDEFQDTSVTQVELLERLTQGWSEGDGRTLFLVGDPMQSIYRFRQADVGLFLRARLQGIGELPLQSLRLATNFRSVASVVDWINASFAQVLPSQDDVASGAVSYAPASQWHDDAAGAGVQVHPLIGEPEATRRQEAERVVAVVQAARAAQPKASIAVLVRARAHLAQIVPALAAAGIAVHAVDIDPLAHRPAVVDALALTRALVHPADRIAWLALLRAPWCGLELADLLQLVEGAAREPVWSLLCDDLRLMELSDAGRGRALAAREALRPALDGARRASLRMQVEAAWLRLGGPDTLQAPRDADDVAAFFDLLDRVAVAGDVPRLAQLKAALEKLYAQAAGAVNATDAATDTVADAVQVMTIHKAKGLEFDVVIVPALERLSARDTPQLLAWTERARAKGAGSDLLLGAMAARGSPADRVHAYIGRLQAQRAHHESQRLLYVAATRARQQLHLVGAVRLQDDAPAPHSPAGGTLLALLWPAVRTSFDAAALDAPRVPAGESGRATVVLDPMHWRLPWPRPLPVVPAAVAWEAAAAPRSGDVQIEFSWAGETVRHIGTAVHRLLQRIAGDAPAWPAARIAAARPGVVRSLLSLGVPPAGAEAAAARVLEAVVRALGDERGQWVLQPHAKAANELKLTGVVDGELVNVAIDRTFVAAGVRWVIDYKTSMHEGANREGFLDQEQERYRGQLERYARLAASLGPESVHCGLYFPLLGGWRSWQA